MSLLALIYPPLCLACEASLPGQTKSFLCLGCSTLLELLETNARCSFCFGEVAEGKKICGDCLKRDSPLQGVAAALEYWGPAASLVKCLKYQHQTYLAAGLAAFLVAQFARLNWPWPDFIVPVPQSWVKWCFRGYNQSLLLALEVGKLLDRPVLQALKRGAGDFSQAGLKLGQRRELKGEFRCTNPSVADRCLLLIDDVWTSGSTLRCCAEALQSACPSSIFALTVCRAEEN